MKNKIILYLDFYKENLNNKYGYRRINIHTIEKYNIDKEPSYYFSISNSIHFGFIFNLFQNTNILIIAFKERFYYYYA